MNSETIFKVGRVANWLISDKEYTKEMAARRLVEIIEDNSNKQMKPEDLYIVLGNAAQFQHRKK